MSFTLARSPGGLNEVLPKNYTAYVERKIKCLDKDGVRITKEEIIRIGIALRPLV